jgi:hypothetical protein
MFDPFLSNVNYFVSGTEQWCGRRVNTSDVAKASGNIKYLMASCGKLT